MPKPIQYTAKPKVNNDKVVIETLLDNIGTPDDLIEVEVKPLWGDSLRLNVYREVKGLRKMTDSFFVEMVEDGLVARPPMTRRYYDDVLAKIQSDLPVSASS